MVDPIFVQGVGGVAPGGGKGRPSVPDSVTPFKDLLENSILRVNEMQQAAEKAKVDLVTGGTENIGEALASVKKAELAFQQLVEIRNKLVDAYQEIMRMQV